MWHIIALLCIFIHWINIFDVVCSYFLKELLPFTAALEFLQHGGNFVSFLLTVRNLLTTVLLTVSSDIFEDYKVYISSKLTFIIFFWFLFRSLGYFNCGYCTGGKNIVKKWVTLSRRLFFLHWPKYPLFNYVFYLHKPLWWLHCISYFLCSVVCDAASPPQTVKLKSQYRDFFFFIMQL